MMNRIALAALGLALPALAADPKDPTWWDKYTYLVKNGEDPLASVATSSSSGTNVDVSNECGPQSETYIAINPSRPQQLAAGSNEIFRDPMRGYFSTDSGESWGGVDLPLPPPIGTNGIRFGSDPTLAFDCSGNLFYGYIVVFFGDGQRRQWDGDGRRALDGRRQDVSAGDLLLLLRRQRPLQRQADDHRRRERGAARSATTCTSPGTRRAAAPPGRRRARCALERSRHDVHRHARRRSERVRALHRRRPSRPARTARSTWRGTTTPRTRSSSTRSLDGGATWGTAARHRLEERAVRHPHPCRVHPRARSSIPPATPDRS